MYIEISKGIVSLKGLRGLNCWDKGSFNGGTLRIRYEDGEVIEYIYQDVSDVRTDYNTIKKILIGENK